MPALSEAKLAAREMLSAYLSWAMWHSVDNERRLMCADSYALINGYSLNHRFDLRGDIIRTMRF